MVFQSLTQAQWQRVLHLLKEMGRKLSTQDLCLCSFASSHPGGQGLTVDAVLRSLEISDALSHLRLFVLSKIQVGISVV